MKIWVSTCDIDTYHIMDKILLTSMIRGTRGLNVGLRLTLSIRYESIEVSDKPADSDSARAFATHTH